MDKSTVSEKITEAMAEDEFWGIIHDSIENSEDSDGQLEFIRQHLAELPLESVVAFRLRTDALLFDSYRQDLWCAAYLAQGGCSDDGFEYFRLWLISRGKKAFYSVLENPDVLADFVPPDDEPLLDFEELWYVANGVFEERTEKDLDDFVDRERFTKDELHYPPIEFTWSDEKPETMKAICPRLYEEYWEK